MPAVFVAMGPVQQQVFNRKNIQPLQLHDTLGPNARQFTDRRLNCELARERHGSFYAGSKLKVQSSKLPHHTFELESNLER